MSRSFLTSVAVPAAVLVGAILTAGCGGPGSAYRGKAVATVNGVRVPADELVAALPSALDSASAEDTVRAILDVMILNELYVQEAERLGLETDIRIRYEMEEKGLVTQELYNEVVARGNTLTDAELRDAHELLKTENHIKVIEVQDEKTALRIAGELGQGAEFETLAVRYSTDRTARLGGDRGYMPELAIEEPMRSEVRELDPGGITRPVRTMRGYQIVKLVDRRKADPAPPPLEEMREQLEMSLKQQQRRRLANEFLNDLRSRLTYNQEGLDILCKPVDSITGEEQEVWVATRDNTKYVKVGRLLNIARRFPATLDTAMKKYTIRREIEEDLLYEDALEKGLNKLPDVAEKLEQKRKSLLRSALYEKEVEDKAVVTDAEVRAYFEMNRDNYSTSDFGSVEGLIQRRLKAQREQEIEQNLAAGLKAKAEIVVDEAVVKAIVRDMLDVKKEQQ
jgi:parvulin-like peptidyl-prolyl isomerase